MTGSITFVSDDEFELDYIEALHEEAAELAQDHVWWNEPPRFFENPEQPFCVSGACKLLHRYIAVGQGAPKNVDYRDDILMGMVDYFAVVEILTILSKEHEFTWLVSQPAEPRDKLIGKIADGKIEPRLFEFLIPEMEALKISENDIEDTELHERIRAKYFGSPVS